MGLSEQDIQVALDASGLFNLRDYILIFPELCSTSGTSA
jgi:hypothetical protein